MPKCVGRIPRSRICRYFPVRRSYLIFLYTFNFKKFTMFLKLKNIYIYICDQVQKLVQPWSNQTGSARPGLCNAFPWDTMELVTCIFFVNTNTPRNGSCVYRKSKSLTCGIYCSIVSHSKAMHITSMFLTSVFLIS